MPNSTYKDTCNRIARSIGIEQVTDNTTFNTGTLSQHYQQIKDFVDEANRMLSLDTKPEYLKRVGTITTTAVVADNDTGYALACGFESVIPDSFFITTTGKGQPLDFKSFEDYTEEDPDGHTTKGRPRYFVPRPGTDVSGADRISFDPAPDAVYTVQYEYFYEAPVLSSATDIIVWKPRFEHLLWQAGRKFMEYVLAEGKVPEASEYVLPSLLKVRQMSIGFAEQPPTVTMEMSINSLQRGIRSAWSPD